MDLSDFSCFNCSTEDNKSVETKYRGRRYRTIIRKSDEKTSCVDRHERPVSTQVIKVQGHDRAYPTTKSIGYVGGTRESDSSSSTYRRATDVEMDTDDIDDNVVSSAQFGDFSVQVYSLESRTKHLEEEHMYQGEISKYQEALSLSSTGVFSRASMMSSTPYRDVRRKNEREITQVQKSLATPGNILVSIDDKSVASHDEITRSSTSTKDRKVLMKFDHASNTRATLPGDSKKRIKLEQTEIPSTSFSLPRSYRLSQTEDALKSLPPLRPAESPESYVPELLFKETSFHSSSLNSPTNVSPPLTPNRKRVVKKLLTKHTKTRKDFAQLYIASMQKRRTRYSTKNWDLSSNRSSSDSSRKSVKSTSSISKVFSDRKWLDETEELISASNEATNEAMSREDYFKIVFFEESLRRKLQIQEISQLEEEVLAVFHLNCTCRY